MSLNHEDNKGALHPTEAPVSHGFSLDEIEKYCLLSRVGFVLILLPLVLVWEFGTDHHSDWWCGVEIEGPGLGLDGYEYKCK